MRYSHIEMITGIFNMHESLRPCLSFFLFCTYSSRISCAQLMNTKGFFVCIFSFLYSFMVIIGTSCFILSAHFYFPIEVLLFLDLSVCVQEQGLHLNYRKEKNVNSPTGCVLLFPLYKAHFTLTLIYWVEQLHRGSYPCQSRTP